MTRSILFLSSPYAYRRSEEALLAALAERTDIAIREVPHERLAAGDLGGRFDDFDVVIVFVPFWRLRQAADLAWHGFSGERVLYDHDAIQHFSTLAGNEFLGAWTPEIRRHQFSHLLCTGRAVRDRFRSIGVPATWVPKGFDPSVFAPSPEFATATTAPERHGIVSYGSPYPSRAILERALVDRGLPFQRLTIPYPDLGASLRRHVAALAVSAELPRHRLVRGAWRRLPPRYMPIRPGLEPMIKLFEIGAAGCVPIVDDMADLQPLGFIDGDSAITFRSIRALINTLDDTIEDQTTLRRIGASAHRLCWERHTWAHRADEIVEAFR